ncbi:MAG: DUF1573 domain-containing protein [Chitinophagaceae bacterium]|nr:DUF1573 domain-containing protein [Chitinophagaceae bacterium]
MKTIMLALSVMLFSTAVFSQAKKAEDLIKFKETVYDFGKIKQGVPVTHEFPFTNVSDKPVVVENATASCGCTTPSWPQAPVAKGKTDKITAGFNAAAPGAFTKNITVKFAGADAPTQVTIKGEVLKADDYAKFEQTKSK